MNTLKRTVFILTLLTTLLPLASQTFELSPKKDGIILGTSISLCATNLFLDKVLDIDDEKIKESFDKDDINFIDKKFMQKYSKSLDFTGDLFVAASVLTPAVLLTTEKDQWFTIATMYAETILVAHGIKEFGKLIVQRPRPYMYFEDYPTEDVKDGDWNKSFPSGHTTFAFAGATFASYTFSNYYPESKLKLPIIVASYSLATTTAILRMASGNHYLTDVLAGAAIGTFSGFIVPWLHKKNNSDKIQITLGPAGVNFNIKL